MRVPASSAGGRPPGPSRLAIPLVGLLLAGCSDKGTLGIRHEPPAVTIQSPSDGSSFFEGQSVRFEALVQTFDSDEDITSVTHSWVSGTETMCTSAAVQADGIAYCDFVFDGVSERTVTVTVTDSFLDTASATVTVNVLENTAPSITLTTPGGGDFFEPGELIVFEAEVDDAEDSAEDLVVEIISSLDGNMGLDPTPSSSGSWTGAGTLSNGDHLITARVTDSAGRSDQATATISVNARPGAPGVVITPDPAASGYELKAVVTTPASDPEGDAITYRYDWYLGSTLYQSGSNDRISRGVTVRDEYWEVYAYPNDGFGYGDPGYANVTIENSPPAIDSVAISPAAPTTVDTLTAVPAGWDDQDSDPERYRYQWTVNDTIDASETSSTYPAAKTEKGDLVKVTVTPYDSFESGDPVDSTTTEIVNSQPTEPTISISPEDPEPEDSLYCDVDVRSTDADGDTVSYVYSWYKDGALTSITGNVVDSSYTRHGEGWECNATPWDGEDYGDAGSAYVTVNDGTAPAAPGLNNPGSYLNDTSVTLSGTCEAGCTVTYYCSDSSSSTSETTTCTSGGTHSKTTTLTRGDVTECYATCTDSAGNVSPDSATRTIEVCDPWDEYEDATGYGDSGPDAIGEWSAMSDDGTDTVSIEGNILDDDDDDWYVISATDDISDDLSAGLDYFNFEVNLVEGSSTYEFYVYKDGYDGTDGECSSAASEYGWKNQDKGGADHAIPSDTRRCAEGSNLYNECEDDSATFYVQVKRKASVAMSCRAYELEITNGVW
ncbi:MAG: hypothetical protein H6742_09660 [Alphaproteobacteria bacterium]|nr:hypothetical protein [Alphaproteobacteria bacterium]